MKKRELSLAIALVLSLSVGTMAFASPPAPESSTGTITFKAPVPIDDGPKDPGDPGPIDITGTGLKPLSINFGTGRVFVPNRTNIFRTDDKNENAEKLQANANGKALSAGIRPAYSDDADGSGIIIVSSEEKWELGVTVKGFFHNSTPALQGFELVLEPGAPVTGTLTDFETSTSKFIRNRVAIAASIGGAEGAGATFATGTGGVKDKLTFYGCNFEAELAVPGGTDVDVFAGEAKTVLTWTYSVTP